MALRDVAAGHLVAWIALGAINAIVGGLTASGSAFAIAVAHVFDGGHMLALGLVSWGSIVGWDRWGPRRGGLAVLALLAVAVGQLVLVLDLIALSTPFTAWRIWSRVIPALFALCVPLAAWVGERSSASRARYAAATVAFAIAVGHQLVLPGLYGGLHTFASWFAATLLGSASTSWMPGLRRRFEARRTLLMVAAVVVAATALIVSPPASVRTHLASHPGAVLSRYLPAAEVGGTASGPRGEWYRDRRGLPDVPPSDLRLLPERPIVVLVLVDAMRHDVPAAEHAQHMPNLSRIAESGVRFERAYALSPQTRATVAGLFAGRYPSQLSWAMDRRGSRKPRLWPADESLRFVDLLEKRGVHTAVTTHMRGLDPKHELTKGTRSAIGCSSKRAPAVVRCFLDWHASHVDEALFAYIHFVDAHAPYDSAAAEGTPFARYLAELGIVDRALQSLIEGFRERQLSHRTLFIISADHGEAFGTHNTRYHGSSVYDEQVRVPLIVSHPRLKPAVIAQMGSLIDLAPTVLDLFGLAAPGAFMGQSLVPLFAGQNDRLTRPVFVDSQLKTAAMVFEDGQKVISRRGAAELYDLRADPLELDNVFDQHDDAGDRLAALRQFMLVHQMVQH